jgi:hypothetical protein
MKFIVQTTSIIIISFLLQYFLPWWTMAIASFAIAFIFDDPPFKSFLSGFVAIGLLWLSMAFFIDFTTDSILTVKINKLLPLNVFVLTTLIGGLVGGLSSLTGALLRIRR